MTVALEQCDRRSGSGRRCAGRLGHPGTGHSALEGAVQWIDPIPESFDHCPDCGSRDVTVEIERDAWVGPTLWRCAGCGLAYEEGTE